MGVEKWAGSCLWTNTGTFDDRADFDYRLNFKEPFVLQIDANSVSLGAVLTQTIKSEKRVIAFASRALTDPEKKYSVTGQECSVVWAIQKFRSYLEGYRLTVITDYSSLVT